MPHKHLECPHCEGPVPVELEELMAAFAVPTCTACGRAIYLTAGKLSNFQPDPTGLSPSYDPGE